MPGWNLLTTSLSASIGVVEVEADGLVAGHGGGHPRLGPEGERRQREDLEQALDGLGGVEEGLGQAVVVSGAEREGAADRLEAVDAQLLDQDLGLLGLGLLPLDMALITTLMSLATSRYQITWAFAGIGLGLGLGERLGRRQRVVAALAMGGQVLDDVETSVVIKNRLSALVQTRGGGGVGFGFSLVACRLSAPLWR